MPIIWVVQWSLNFAHRSTVIVAHCVKLHIIESHTRISLTNGISRDWVYVGGMSYIFPSTTDRNGSRICICTAAYIEYVDKFKWFAIIYCLNQVFYDIHMQIIGRISWVKRLFVALFIHKNRSRRLLPNLLAQNQCLASGLCKGHSNQ